MKLALEELKCTWCYWYKKPIFFDRPTVAGIHGSETEGCYSLALSGGYEDDIDLGESFTYTGEGMNIHPLVSGYF